MKIFPTDVHSTFIRYKNYLKSFLYNTLLLVISLALTYFLSPFTGGLYCYFTKGGCSGGLFLIDLTAIIGMFFNYLFFVPLIFVIFGDRNKHWWVISVLVVTFVFLGYMFYETGSLWRDIGMLFIFILISFGGIGLGLAINKFKKFILKKRASI